MKKCKNCGELNSPKTIFCFNCGCTAFFEEDSIICPVCSEANDTSFDFCLQCGAKLGNSDTQYQKADNNINQNIVIDADTENLVPCPYCNSNIKLDTIFCPSCGQDVSEYNNDRIIKKAVCINCGRPNDLGNKYCSYCFGSLEKAIVTDYEVSFAEKERLEDIKLLQAIIVGSDNEDRIFCPECHTINSTTETYCETCGTLLKLETPKKYCFVCGAENNFNAAYCINCQFPFGNNDSYNDSIDITGEEWNCVCGCINSNDSDFCTSCGKKKSAKAK